ncbi:MAG: hypothetical protein HY319_26730 [Armatimonadetes bacterium]|nr:hypothetical protein [Armatimonadota bacterium]
MPVGSHPTDSLTIAAVVAWLRDWLAGGSRPPLEAVESVLRKVEQAAAETERELLEQPDVDPELRGSMEGCLDAYELLREGLQGVCRSLSSDRREEAGVTLAILEAGSEELQHHRRAVAAWLEAPLPRCPRCGSAGPDWHCPGCRLDRLVPDADAVSSSSWETATLPPDFLLVHEAYRALQLGEGPLNRLLESVLPLEARMRSALTLSQREHPEIACAAQLCLEGIEDLREATETRAMKSVNQGWRQIFEAGRRLQELMPGILQAAGREVPVQEPQDSVSIQGPE